MDKPTLVQFWGKKGYLVATFCQNGCLVNKPESLTLKGREGLLGCPRRPALDVKKNGKKGYLNDLARYTFSAKGGAGGLVVHLCHRSDGEEEEIGVGLYRRGALLEGGAEI